MNSIEKINKSQLLLQELVTKSRQSNTFKEQLISNPKNTIKGLTGFKSILSAEIKIIVEDQTDEKFIYLNIPRKVNIVDLELTNKELEAISGGDFGLSILGGLAACALYEIGGGFYKAYKDFH
jgi:bacteriocin-like protein